MKYLSLFSGIGGFELGIQQAYENYYSKITGVENQKGAEVLRQDMPNTPSGDGRQLPTCIGYSEIDKYAIQIYEKHFGCTTHTQQGVQRTRTEEGFISQCTDQCTNRFAGRPHKNYGDITKINVSELPDFDLLVGGFPCQAFSIAGKRRGFDDTRGTLFFDIARILKEKRPRNFVLENVKGLLSHDNGRTFKTIISTLVELGYCVEWQVLNAKNFGVPQNRERVFIVGHLGRIPERKVFPIGNDSKETNGERIISTTLDSHYGSGIDNHGQRSAIIQINNPKHSNDRVYSEKGLSPTLNTAQGGNRQPFIPEDSKIRRLTPLECERLMGYPDGWTEGLSDTQRYKTLGNGIVSNVVAEVVRRLYIC